MLVRPAPVREGTRDVSSYTVMQVVPSLDAGGAERTTVDIANALVRTGWHAIVASEGGRMEKDLDAAVEFLKMPMAGKNPFEMAGGAALLIKAIGEKKVNLIHARSRAPAWSALMASRRTNISFVTTYHGIYNAGNFLKRFYNSVMARGDAVIANSEGTAAHVRATYPWAAKRVTVVPRGVDMARFDPGAVSRDRITAVRAAWNLREGERVVLLPGRIARWKGQVVFLEAMAKLKAEGRLHAAARPIIVGDAQGRFDYVDELRRAIAEQGLASIAALLDHTDDMPAAYAAADVVVSASTDPEAFGRVAAEASAMARPVVATDHGGARETVVPGETGLLVPPGDAAALADAVADLLSRPYAALAQMGMAGRAHIAAHYTLERMCAQTLAVYEKLLSQTRAKDR